MSQEKRILVYLSENLGITSAEAYQKLGIMRLSARILELKEQGYPIVGVFEESYNRFGDKVRYKRYYLRNAS